MGDKGRQDPRKADTPSNKADMPSNTGRQGETRPRGVEHTVQNMQARKWEARGDKTCLPPLSPFLFPLSPLVSLLVVSLCRMICPPSCLPLSPLVSLLVYLCWVVPPPLRGSCLPFSPVVSPCLLLFPFVGLCIRPPESPLVSFLVSLCWMACPPSRGSCLPLASLVSPCLPLSPLVSLLV